MNKYKMAIGITIIAATGVLAGLLIAPQKGSKFRRKIKRNFGKLINSVMENFNQMEESEDVAGKSPSVTL